MSTPGLTAFQIELATTFSLPESAGFLLAGGGALIARVIVPRLTEDLAFSPPAGSATSKPPARQSLGRSVPAGGPRISSAAALTSGVGRSPGPETVLVDLAVDSPSTGTPKITIAGPALDPTDLVARKTLALFGRAEPRDYIDVYALNQRFNRDDTLSKAAAADPGFNHSVFVQALRAHQRIGDADFPDIGVAITEIRTYFDAWADELDER